MVFLADKGTEGCVDFRFDGFLERRDAWCGGGRDEVSPFQMSRALYTLLWFLETNISKT